MSDPLQLGFDFLAEEHLSGFRLQRLEVLNWGTFNGRVWVFELNGNNILLTGDIGSGKSTLVDAVTTLLVPAQRIAYNKAAGADSKERSLKSYVLGHFKSERNEESGLARPVSLRNEKSLSVLLGVFYNKGYDQSVTLAQVFWIKEGQPQPARFFVGAERELTIAGDFTGFGGDVSRLKKRLRSLGAEIEETFPKYGSWYRRRFGIENEQAMELFHQTISMKSVGNLTEFVRLHMLEAFEVEPRMEALIRHFDDLNRAHLAVVRAKQQVERLTPLVQASRHYGAVMEEVMQLRECRSGLGTFFAEMRLDLVLKRLSDLELEWLKQEAKVKKADLERQHQQIRLDEVRRAIMENGGDRLERLALDIKQREGVRDARKARAVRYADLLESLDETMPRSQDDFLGQLQTFRELREHEKNQEQALQNDQTEEEVHLRQVRDEHRLIDVEISSLRKRRSNIDLRQIEIRTALCLALNIHETDMPFAGELIQVRDEEKDWEGAAERILRGFGLSLLVPEAHYASVVEWVDRSHLKGRLVYFNVRTRRPGEMPALSGRSLVRKLAVKPDAVFYDWLDRELAHRFDVACCDSEEAFRREPRAITMRGQIKDPSGRHEKDDRHRIDDRSRYVLGWTNVAKIEALEWARSELERRMGAVGARISEIQGARRRMEGRLHALARLEEFQDYEELNWEMVARDIGHLQKDYETLKKASDVLRILEQQLTEAQHQLAQADSQLIAARDRRSRLEARREDHQLILKSAQALLLGASLQDATRERLKVLVEEALFQKEVTLEGCGPREQEVRTKIQERIDSKDSTIKVLSEKLVRWMTEFNELFKLETMEINPALESRFEYERLLDQLEKDDLPRFLERFKEMLNVNTINEIAHFNAQLSKERETIRERIERINQSLTQIDYNDGRYIRLEAMPTMDPEIRGFQSDLRACTEGTLSGTEDSQYSETRFVQVKNIIDRFRGREGLSDQDQKWTDKVTDVRNWFTFGASERWREDHAEYEHYADSGGKSGGQKEKLAYTILAASLAYQFGLEWGALRSRSFRFVVIDEAFGRGSDDSTEYGLKLFRNLNLQLLIVTPLQKIHVIEPFIAGVGFVHNEGGKDSQILNLTVEEYHDQEGLFMDDRQTPRAESAPEIH